MQEGNTLRNLGVLYRRQGKLERARSHLENALSIHRDTGNRAEEAAALCTLGNLDLDEGRKIEGQKKLESALEILAPLGDGVQ